MISIISLVSILLYGCSFGITCAGIANASGCSGDTSCCSGDTSCCSGDTSCCSGDTSCCSGCSGDTEDGARPRVRLKLKPRPPRPLRPPYTRFFCSGICSGTCSGICVITEVSGISGWGGGI